MGVGSSSYIRAHVGISLKGLTDDQEKRNNMVKVFSKFNLAVNGLQFNMLTIIVQISEIVL